MDQPFWVARLHGLGIAATPLNPRKPDGDAVRAALAEVATDAARRRAAEVARRISGEPDGVTVAIDAIQRICAR